MILVVSFINCFNVFFLKIPAKLAFDSFRSSFKSPKMIKKKRFPIRCQFSENIFDVVK